MSELDIRLPEIIGLTILHSLWQITLLWIILVAVLRLNPRASSAVRYTFAISILILSVLTTGATAWYEWQLHTTSEVVSALPNGSTQTVDIVYSNVTSSFFSRIADLLNASVPILAWIWCAGLVVMGVRFGGSLHYVRTLRAQKNIAAIPPSWKRELERLSMAIGLRRNVAIATSTRISSPLTLGSLFPIILLPTGLLSGMSTAQIEAILVHELYHIKRRDYIINICQALIEVLLFYHPALWHINKIIRDERENCCDDQTLAFCGDAITYARTLTQIQELTIFTKPTLAMSAIGPNAGNFSYRIKRLFNIYPNPAQARSKGIFAIGILIVYLSIVLATANISTAQQVEAGEELIKTSMNDYENSSTIFQDSVTVSDLYIPDGNEIIRQQKSSVAGEKIPAMDIQPVDTTVQERSLDKCLRQVRLILKMTSINGLPGDRFKFSAADSLQLVASIDRLTQTTLKLQPIRFFRAANQSTISTLDVIDTTGNETTNEELMDVMLKAETSTEEFTKIVAVHIFPNATTGHLNISFTPTRNNSHVKMILLDSDGKVVKEITDSTYDNIPTALDVDVSTDKKGIYILQIIIDGVKSQQRVLVE